MLVSDLIKIVLSVGGISFVLCVLIIYSQRWHGRLTHDHDLNGVQKFHATPVPRIGGLAIIGGIIFGIHFFKYIHPGEIKESIFKDILMLIVASLPAFIAGFVEDITKIVSIRVRLAATVCSALLASVLLGATVDELDIWGVDTLLTLIPIAITVTAVMVAGGANAINIIDGFNGLAGSVIVIISAALGAIAWQVGDSFVAVLGALSAGGTLGFLLINYPSGKLFLGDGGAYFCGFWVSEMAVLMLVRNPTINAWQILSICAFPIIEVLFSIYRRKFIKNNNIGAADALHLHTLIYRRIVSRIIPHNPNQLWRRNAAVALLLVPCIAVAVFISFRAGGEIISGMVIVFCQVVIYQVVYARLVRGKWGRKNRSRNDISDTKAGGSILSKHEKNL